MTWLQLGMLAGAVTAGMGAGMAYVFSTGVMQALGQLPPAEAVRAMQGINEAVINPRFLGVFLGTGLWLAGLSAGHLLTPGQATNPWLLAGTGVYVGGMVLVTIGGNVPLNDALAGLDPEALPDRAWAAYARPWLVYNHLRSLAGAVAAGLLVVAAMR